MNSQQFQSKKECIEAIKKIPKKYSTNRKWNEYLCENIIPKIDNSFFEDEEFAYKVLKIPYELSDLWIVDDYPNNNKGLNTLDKIFDSLLQSSSYNELLERENYDESITEYFLRVNHHIGEHVNKFQGMLQWDVLMSHFIIYSISEVFYIVCERSEKEIDYFKLIGVRLAPDLYAELEEESIYDPIMGTVFKTGVLDSFSYSAEYTQGFKNITYEDIYSFNNKFKIQQEISLLSPPKELLETYASAVIDLFENELFSDCETLNPHLH